MSFETIPVEIPGGPGDWDQAARQIRRYPAEALLVPETRVQAAYGADEVRLRLPEGEGIAVGERIALRRDPPGEAILELLEEETDVAGKSLWRARIARPPADAGRHHDPFEEARRQKQRDQEAYHASMKRWERRMRERVESMNDLLDDDAAQALLTILKSDLDTYHLRLALRERLACESQHEVAVAGQSS